MPSTFKRLLLLGGEMAKTFGLGGGTGFGGRSKRFPLKLEPGRSIVSVDLLLGKFLLYVELNVLGNEAVGGELADDPPDPPVEEPLGAHTESNGSHRIAPPGKRKV